MGFQCVECKRSVFSTDLRYTEEMNAQLIEAQMCFKCNFWTERLNYQGDHAVVRFEGHHFMYDTKRPWNEDTNTFRGHGGAIFKITFHLADVGQSVLTNDLWAQGEIPKHFRSRMPDNAVIERVPNPAIQRFRELLAANNVPQD
jgi:hypothetical protein